jgi:hypothetical protein
LESRVWPLASVLGSRRRRPAAQLGQGQGRQLDRVNSAFHIARSNLISAPSRTRAGGRQAAGRVLVEARRVRDRKYGNLHQRLAR